MTAGRQRPVIELIVLVASAGGLGALTAVLRDLPCALRAAVVVQQHLGGHDNALADILARRAGRPVDWAQRGQRLGPGRVVVCPPGAHLEFSGHGTCRMRPALAAGERRFDVLLSSAATVYGPRSVGVVLSGCGQDGAAGTAAMTHAGALVIAESPDTAQYPSMPVAAAHAGAVVLRVEAIGRALAALVDGTPPSDALGQARAAPVTRDDAARPTGFDSAWASDAVSNAAGRAELAGLRAAELARRRAALSAGARADAASAATAQRRAAESRRRAQLAHQAAAAAAARWAR